jgi:ligand-binding sensor domain-containing protein/DNA-binding CsgD family transcriptional regulator
MGILKKKIPFMFQKGRYFTTLYSLLYLGILILGNPSFGQKNELVPYLINNFDLHNQTWGISQDPKTGIVYLANSEGLIEYNGIKWIKHTLSEGIPVRSVLIDENSNIFTGSFEEFGVWNYNSRGELVYQSLTNQTQVEKNDEIWKIYQSNGLVFFQSFTSIYVYNYETIEKVKSPQSMLFLHQIGNRFIAQIIEDGLYWFENKEFTKIHGSELFNNKKVHAIVPFENGKWLVCTDNYGLYVFNGQSFSFYKSEASDFLMDYVCNTAKQLNDSIFAFGSILNGVIITNKKGEIQRSYNTHNGLKNNTVLSFFQDKDAGLWVGLDEGVNYINLQNPLTHYESRNGSFGTIYALLAKDSLLYIGTNHGLFVADIVKKGAFPHFQNLRIIQGSQGQVWYLREYGNQIICGHNNGTYVATPNEFVQISSITGGWAYTPLGNYIVGGTYTGIIVLEKSSSGDLQFKTKLENFNEPSRFLEVDYLGYLWVAHHQKGVYKIEVSDDALAANKVEYFNNIDGKTQNIKVFKVNNRVVFTTSNNIYTYDYVRNEIVTLEPLSDDIEAFKSSSHIHHSQKNEYWFIKEDRIALFEIGLDFSAIKKYEIQLSNISLPQRGIQLVSLDSKTVLIPTHHGFDAFNLSLSQLKPQESRLRVEKVVFYGSIDSERVYFNQMEKVKTKWNMNNVTISFIAPYAFDQPSKSFNYRIKELDSSWQNTSNSSFTYSGLKYGLYTLEIQASDGSTDTIQFQVEKPWYYSHFALVIYSLIIALAVWLLVRYFRFKLNRQKEVLEMELRQRSLERELDTKSYELMLTIRYLISKNEILTELQNEVNAIKENSSKYPIKNLRNMEKIITEGLDTQTEDWKNAMNSLKLSQQGFFKKLKEQFPNLTPNDLRLCSYLRMNFTTKEIARLLNNSTRAVEISRYRLRKKMNLKHDVNLTEYLMRENFSETSNGKE